MALNERLAQINDRGLRAAFKALGLRLPDGLQQDLDEIRTTRIGMTEGWPDESELINALAAAVRKGGDPLTDKTVTRMLNARTLRSVNFGVRVDAWEGEQLTGVYKAHEEPLFAAIVEASRSAGEKIAQAAGVLGDADLTDADLIRQGGRTSMAAWADADESAATLNKIDQAWKYAHALTSREGVGGGSARLARLLPDITPEIADGIESNAPFWQIAAHHGQSIQHATPAEYRERLNRLRDRTPTTASEPAPGLRTNPPGSHTVTTAEVDGVAEYVTTRN